MLAAEKETYALTGAGGFLGWHVKLALHASGRSFVEIPLGDKFDLAKAAELVGKSHHVLHLAGVNRGDDTRVASDNLRFAEQLVDALVASDAVPASLTYANSSQCGNETVYGQAKLAAGGILQRAADQTGIGYRDLMLPNLFGEHGRPFYNSVVATFCHMLATGDGVRHIQQDRELTLLHAQDAADWLIGDSDVTNQDRNLLRFATVSELLARLQDLATVYARGEFPELSTPFARDLFNTYRSFLPLQAVPLREHVDPRGSFVELTRSWGGTGQSSFSTTHPGVTRGNHYHRRKVERFAVLSGIANLSMRRMFTGETISFETDGSPIMLDQRTGWTHNLTNVGDETLTMFFWTNDIFDPANPDTVMEPVS